MSLVGQRVRVRGQVAVIEDAEADDSGRVMVHFGYADGKPVKALVMLEDCIPEDPPAGVALQG